jgi:hypothetical protein
MGTIRPKRELFQLRFRWGPREQTQSECEEATLRFLKGLKRIDPIFQKWRSDIWGRNERIALDPAGMHTLLERSAFRSDIWRRRIVENGYNIRLGTFGPNDEHCSVHLNIGSYGHPRAENECRIEPPYIGASAKRLWRTGAIQELCRWIIRSWSPNSGEVYSSESLKLIDDFNAYDPRPGWIMYTTRAEAAQLFLPKPSSVEQIVDRGRLITVVPQLFNSANERHAEQLRRVFRAIDPRIPEELLPRARPNRRRRKSKA